MDPATAIGVGSSVLAFLDVSIKVVNGAVEIYHSAEGMTSENAHLEKVTRDMKSCSESMMKRDTAVRTAEEQSIVSIAEECHKFQVAFWACWRRQKSRVETPAHCKASRLRF